MKHRIPPPPPPVPVTEAEYRDLCPCRCARLPHTHLAVHCADVEAVTR